MAAKRRSSRIPSFRLHKPTGQGFVEIRGRRRYLGRYDKEETQQKYRQVIADEGWVAWATMTGVPVARSKSLR